LEKVITAKRDLERNQVLSNAHNTLQTRWNRTNIVKFKSHITGEIGMSLVDVT
jgi:hypothetical protein